MFETGGPTFLELTQQALSSTVRGYDRIAPKFDRTPFRTPDEILDAVGRSLGRVEGAALDLCCGTGAGAGMLRGCVNGPITGIDFSEGMLEVARSSVPGVTFLQMDARALTFEAAFDLIVSFGAFGHFTVPEQPELLRGIHRALRPGGRFVFVTAEHPPALHPTALLYRGFNLVMRVRNRLLRPRFIMYYLNFLLPEAATRLEEAGFRVEIQPLDAKGPFPRAKLVSAWKD